MTLGRETSQLSADLRRRGIEVVPPAIACQESFAVFARCEGEPSELAGDVESLNRELLKGGASDVTNHESRSISISSLSFPQ
jgi:hypothetical protein